MLIFYVWSRVYKTKFLTTAITNTSKLFIIIIIFVSASTDKPSIFDMYPRPYIRRVEMLTDSVDIEQINPAKESLTPQYIPKKQRIAVTADYDENYVERKPKFRKTQFDKLLDAGFELKRRFTLSDMYVKSYERKGNKIPHFSHPKTINDNSSKDYNLSNRNIKGIPYKRKTFSNKNSINDNGVKDPSSGKKKKIKILFDDVDNNMLITDTISSSRRSDWEPVAYEQLDLLTASTYSTEQTVTSIPILWESLHYDGVEDLASVQAKIFANKKINVVYYSTSTEKNLKTQSNEIVTRTDLVTRITSQNLGKAVQKDNKEENDDDIEVFKPECTKETNTRKNNKCTNSIVELKQVTVGKYNLKENMDLENLVLSKLNTTYINNSNEEKEIVKISRTDSTESQRDFNLIELLNQTTNGNQESQRNELKLQNNKINQVIPQDLVDDVEEIMKLEKLDTKDVELNLLPSTINDDTTKVFRPFRTTDDVFLNVNFPVLNDTNRNKNFSFLFMNDSFVPEKSDIFFHDLLAEDNQRDIKTKKFSTLTMNGLRFTNAAKPIIKYPSTLKEKVFVKYINRTNPTEESYEALLIEDHSVPVIDDFQVSRLVYKYKQSLSSIAPKRIKTNTGSVPKQTLPVIDYDYLSYNQLSENTPPEERKKTTRENFNLLNANPEHDGKFEWNDYNNYDEVLSNDESESPKWQKVLPLQFPKKKSTNNVTSHFPRLSSLGNHYTLHTKPPRTPNAIILTTQNFMKKNVPDKRVLQLKIRRNSTFPNLKSTSKTAYMFDGIDDILGINNWIDERGADYYEFGDKPVTDPSTSQPRDVMFRRIIYPHRKQSKKHKRSIKSTLFDEFFKTQNFTHLVTLIWHKNSSNKAYKNMSQRIKYGKERQKRKCTPFIIETGKHSNIQSVVSLDNDTITCNAHKVMTATSPTEESNAKTTVNPKTTLVIDSKAVKSENRSSREKPLLRKYLLLEGNQPLSKFAKYKKKSQVKLGNIWRFMANSSMNNSSSHDKDMSYTSNQAKLLVAKTEAIEDNTINTVSYEPKTIVIRTTGHPALSFIKRITVERTFHDDDKETTDLNKTELQPVAKTCDQKTYITVPPALELTQKPINTVFKKIYSAAVTPYKIAKELAFTEKLTERTPSLTLWTPFMYKNEQLNLKPMLETKFTSLTNAIYANDHATESCEPITQHIELEKFLSTTKEPETISLIPPYLFDPTPKNYIFKRVGAAMTTKRNVVNNGIKHTVKSSAIQNNFLTKSLSTLTPSYSFVTDWANTNTKMNKNTTEKHYLSFFSDVSKKHDNTHIISTTTQRKPIPTEVYNKLLQQGQNSSMTAKENTKKIEFNVAKLHVPPNFTNTYVQSTVSVVTKFNVNTYLQLSTSTTGWDSVVTESSTERTTETNKDVTTTLYTTVIESPVTKPSKCSKVLKDTMSTIAPKLKQNTTNHWVYRFVNKYPVIIPRLDNINFLPYTKGVNKGSKAHKHWKSDHPPWVLHFWNKPQEDHDTLSLLPVKLRYRKLESTTEDAVVNLYFKNKINKKSNKLRPARPTMKVPTLPEIKRIKVVPLDKAHNGALIKTECTPSLRSYTDTSESYRTVSKKPLIKPHDRLLLREEARAKQMDEYILFMMRKTTTDTPNKKPTDWSAFKEDNWPTTFMKTVAEHNTPNVRKEFPIYQDLMESLDNEEQELEIKTHPKKTRRDLPKPHKTIIINRANVNDDDLIEISAEQKELRLLDDVDKLLQYYFPSTKPPKFVNLIARTTAATTLLSPSSVKIIHKPITARKQKWRFDSVTRNDVNPNKSHRVVLIGRPRRNIIRKNLQQFYSTKKL